MGEQVGTFRTCLAGHGLGSDLGRSSFELFVAVGDCHRFQAQRPIDIGIVWAGSPKLAAALGKSEGKSQFLLGNARGRPKRPCTFGVLDARACTVLPPSPNRGTVATTRELVSFGA